MLTNIKFSKRRYVKDKNDFNKEIFQPCLTNSNVFNWSSCYFRSTVFLAIRDGLVEFIKNNNGRMKLICSPFNDLKDLEVIVSSNQNTLNKDILDFDYDIQIDSILEKLNSENPDTTLLLSELIRMDLVEIKFVVPKSEDDTINIDHRKFGYFKDENNNYIGFTGSMNATYKGIHINGNNEDINIYADEEEAKEIKDDFDNIWNQTDDKVNVIEYDFLNNLIVKNSIDKIKQKNLDLETLIKNAIKEHFKNDSKLVTHKVDKRKLRPYQELILKNWNDNNRNGLIEMCTGAGKTFTALNAMKQAMDEKNETVVVLVPRELLFNQWYNEINNFFNNDIKFKLIGCGNEFSRSSLKIFLDRTNIKRKCVISTYVSAVKHSIWNTLNTKDNIFLICDEVHNIGSLNNKNLINLKAKAKMGLSATPNRFFDPEGTEFIKKYFINEIHPKYQLSNAISDGYLSKYFYYIYKVNLTDEEQNKYAELSSDISRMLSKKQRSDKEEEKLTNKIIKRADIVKKAKNKIYEVQHIIQEKYQQNQHWLIYLDDKEHIDEYYNILSTITNDLYKYYSEMANKEETLNTFIQNGGIILAINCLDEGVDIPILDNLILVASSQNYRQYVQRRGRALRTHENKPYAKIYDFLTLPDSNFYVEPRFVLNEINRIQEFAKDAVNDSLILNEVEIILAEKGWKTLKDRNPIIADMEEKENE
ncbi:DEAD/DEAH box helicase family protein [Mycoplasma sp. Pen4]|uniref:DEAD/DEAH box helicase family protein n=1 Tax=Mycoplasma sp. Pen4 TaxID=640330 RepID=UPI00165432C7|nr:DEAD/DEAH box helicase family protein [Mycoplasma sp. Pen4]QNM93734.1 DEAD/DEAH box helicase family protein [Mycoplasma sp. Pen4]